MQQSHFLYIYEKEWEKVDRWTNCAYSILRKYGVSDMINIEKISVDELMKEINDNKNNIIIDVRSREEYMEEHIPGAINMNSEELMKGSKISFESYLNKNDIALDGKYIVVYCDRGGRSIYFTKYLLECGYNAVSLTGGYRAYSRQKLKLI